MTFNFLTAALAGRFHISKYPTIKVIINGQIGKKEYRGQRSAEALAAFVIDLLKDPIKQLTSFQDVEGIDVIFLFLSLSFESHSFHFFERRRIFFFISVEIQSPDRIF